MKRLLRQALKGVYIFLFKPFLKRGVRFRMKGAGIYRFDYIFALGEYRNFGNRHNAGFQRWLELCRGKRTVFDIGAHIGLYSIPASTAIDNAGAVYAFEPSTPNRIYLERHMRFNNVGNIKVVPDLAGDHTVESVQFYEADETSPMNSILNTEKREEFKEVQKRQISLDDFCKNENVVPQVIKIDVEGAELNVLKGSEWILKNEAPTIFLSVHPKMLEQLGQSIGELTEFVDAAGYRIYDTAGNETVPARHNEYILIPKREKNGETI